MKLGIAVATTGTVCFAAGSTAGFFYAKHLLKLRYEELAGQEIAQAKAFYSKQVKDQNFPSVDDAAEALLPKEVEETVATYQGKRSTVTITPYHKVELQGEAAESPVKTSNIFAKQPETEADWERRVRNRTEEAPYVITNEEYFAGELEYKQATVTYYEGDGVLADERDDVIDGIDLTIGDDNIIRFGDHSEDDNIVYVRNDRLGIDFEVTRSQGKYSVEVAGFEGT